MQIMTKINDFEEILFESSIIFHVFARKMDLIDFSKQNLLNPFFLCIGELILQD